MTTLNALIALHFIYHGVATAGVFYALWHSNKVHKKSWWKLIAAIFWLVVSIAILFH